MLSKYNSGHWMENTVIFRIFHVRSSICAYFKIMLWSCIWWTITIIKEFHPTWLSTEITTPILSLILFKSNNDELGCIEGYGLTQEGIAFYLQALNVLKRNTEHWHNVLSLSWAALERFEGLWVLLYYCNILLTSL